MASSLHPPDYGSLGGVHLYENPYDDWPLPDGAPVKGVLQKIRWSEVETAPGAFNFSTFQLSALQLSAFSS